VSELNAADVEVLRDFSMSKTGLELRKLEGCSALGFDLTLTSLAQRGLVSRAAQGTVAKQRYWVTDHGLMSAGRLGAAENATQPPG